MSLLGNLHEAIHEGDTARVIQLANDGADLNVTYTQETAFTQAFDPEHMDMTFEIIKHPNFDPNAANQFNRTPLFFAAKHGTYEMVSALLDKGAEVDDCDISGVTPLGATAWYNQHKVAQLLIDRGANINKQDDRGESPLYRACSNVSSDVVKVLLDNGADVNLQTIAKNNGRTFTPLMAALPSRYELEVRKRKMSEMINLTKMMISYGCDLHATQRQGRTVLHVAVDRNEIYSACLLVEQGCDLEVKDKDGLTPFQLAIQPNLQHYEMAMMLLLNGADVNSRLLDKDSGLHVLPLTMVLKSKPDRYEGRGLKRVRLLQSLIFATDLTGKGYTEIAHTLETTSILEEDVEVLQTLDLSQASSLQNICRLRIRNALGQNVLRKLEMLSAPYQVRRFIAMGIDFRTGSPTHCCILKTCIEENDASTLTGLLSQGTPLNIRLAEYSPLTLAAECGSIDAVKVLLEHGADPSKFDVSGQSALHASASKGSIEVVKLLLETQCNVNLLNHLGNTPVQEAANMGHFETVILLLKHGANSSLVGPSGIPVVHLAAGSGHCDAVQCLMKVSDDKMLVDKFGNTALHVAASRGIIYLKDEIRLPALYKEEVLEMLDSAMLPITSEPPRYIRSDGVNHIGVLELLLKNGVDRGVLNTEKKSAVDLARKYFKIAERLF